MPVGAGSIKRAAKTAENEKPTEKKPAAKKPAAERKSAAKPVEKSGNVQKIYGMGEELPIYLM